MTWTDLHDVVHYVYKNPADDPDWNYILRCKPWKIFTKHVNTRARVNQDAAPTCFRCIEKGPA